jgi:hypothetical protein
VLFFAAAAGFLAAAAFLAGAFEAVAVFLAAAFFAGAFLPADFLAEPVDVLLSSAIHDLLSLREPRKFLGVHVQLGYAHYILGVKLFSASIASASAHALEQCASPCCA